ncbi:MAG: V-type ATPase subunit [Caloramator sp.]|jgi:V/A-type H+-transporting ATPase subunit C|uniref:V-type ATPase subunit n=1 Tax=Caloramator sp. TaxID=1871330 RepID=UPI001DFBB51D|nr:V-type ATPase subunit [Caloramator sp.]MBZ4663059.1 V-type ATPase subunit [Caloramator sp.]
MPAVVNYEAINTKVHSILGRRLKGDDYKKLLSLTSVNEIALYLSKNSDYGRYIANDNLNSIHRYELEKKLKMMLIYYIDKFDNYFSGEYRDFFMTFYSKYEIYDLKRLARIIHIEGELQCLREYLIFVDYYKNINVDNIIKAKSIAELIEFLNNSVYYPYLKNLLDGNKEENLFRFEMVLDKTYFSILFKKIKKLSGTDKKAFFEVFGPIIDMINLQWIYRGKKFYNMYSDELFNYTIDGGGKLNYKSIKELCYSKTIEELEDRIKLTPYSFLIKGDDMQDIHMERRMNRYIYYKLINIIRKNKRDISNVLSLMQIIEFEIRDIVSITEMVRYGIELSQSNNFLIKAV